VVGEGGRDGKVVRHGAVSLEIIGQIVVRQPHEIVMIAGFPGPVAFTPEGWRAIRDGGRFGSPAGKPRTVMGADKPSCHLVAARHQVSHAGVDVVIRESVTAPLGEDLLIPLPEFSEVVEGSSGLDRLKETRDRLSGIREHRLGSFACPTPDVPDVVRVRLRPVGIIARAGVGEQVHGHVLTDEHASSTHSTRARTSLGISSEVGIV
jgi:hypothetical protein